MLTYTSGIFVWTKGAAQFRRRMRVSELQAYLCAHWRIEVKVKAKVEVNRQFPLANCREKESGIFINNFYHLSLS